MLFRHERSKKQTFKTGSVSTTQKHNTLHVVGSKCQLRESRSIHAGSFTVTQVLRTTRMCSQLLGTLGGFC